MHPCLTLGFRNRSVLHPTCPNQPCSGTHCLHPWCGMRNLFLLLLPGCGICVDPQLCSCRQCVSRPLSEPLSPFLLKSVGFRLSVHPGKILTQPGLTHVPSWRGIWICSEEECNHHFKFCVLAYSPQTAQTDRTQVTYCSCCAYFLLCFGRENRLKLVLSFFLVLPIIENYQGRENKTEIFSRKAFQLNGFFF